MKAKRTKISTILVTGIITIVLYGGKVQNTFGNFYSYDISTGDISLVLETGYARELSIDERYIVWRAGDVKQHLFAYDTVTSITQQLTSGTTGSPEGLWGFGSPSVSFGKVVWTQIYNPSEPVETEIVLYDLATGAQEIIVPRPGYKILPRISESRVVWELNNDGSFNALDLSTDESTVLHSSPLPGAARPDVSGDLAVYQLWDGHQTSIYGYDFTIDTEFLIHPTGDEPLIDGDMVLFSSPDGLLGKNLSSGELLTVTDGGIGSYELGGNIAVYSAPSGLMGYDLSAQSLAFSLEGLHLLNGFYDIYGSKIIFSASSPPEPSTLLLLDPNGGETLYCGEVYTVNWSCTGSVGDILIEYSINNGQGWADVNTVPNTGSYDWLVPAVYSNECLLKVSDVNDSNITDTSDATFTIRPVCLGDIDCDGNVNFIDYALLVAQLYGDNLYTIPHDTVSVDGDLSEWQDNVEWVSLDKIYHGSPNDVLEARFALKWNEATDKVYVAVIVEDANHVFLDDFNNWNASDRLELYSQGDSAGGNYTSLQESAQQYFIAPDTNEGSWATLGYGEPNIAATELEYAARVEGDFIIYEVGVKQFDNYGGLSGGQTIITELDVNDVVRFDVVVDTRWSPTGFGMLSENMMVSKFRKADNIAQYTLVDESNRPDCLEMRADLDRNCIVDFRDLALFYEGWLCSENP